jgi:hypothetical protein
MRWAPIASSPRDGADPSLPGFRIESYQAAPSLYGRRLHPMEEDTALGDGLAGAI